MEITFQTKKQSNLQQQANFLKLSKIERFYSFLRLSEHICRFPVKHKKEDSSNFIIKIDLET